MPAAAVIPAPIAHIKVVVVKKLVVGGGRYLCAKVDGRDWGLWTFDVHVGWSWYLRGYSVGPVVC